MDSIGDYLGLLEKSKVEDLSNLISFAIIHSKLKVYEVEEGTNTEEVVIVRRFKCSKGIDLIVVALAD